MKKNITLVEVPYRWDRAKESLASSINQVRPELIGSPPGATPIPTSPPKGKYYPIPLSHAQSWDRVQDITGWWTSGKLQLTIQVDVRENGWSESLLG